MKTPNSLKPRMAKVEMISFVLLVLLFISLYSYWRYENNLADVAQQAKIITASELSVNQHVQKHIDTVDFPLPIHIDAPLSALPEKETRVKSAYVNPPLPVHSIKVQTNTVNTATGEIISTRHNSKIEIPARAFVDGKGKVVEGNVKVDYREYHDFRDIFLSGIPMDYNNGDEHGMLESAGMIEINASQNGDQVYVNPENKIRVMLASAYKSDDYNLYFLDQKEKKWKVKGKDEVVLSPKQQPTRPDWIVIDSSETKFSYSIPKYKFRLIGLSDMRDYKKHWYSRKRSPTVFDFRFGRDEQMPQELKGMCGITWRYYGADAQDVYMNMFGIFDKDEQFKNRQTYSGTAYLTPDEEAGEGYYRVNITMDNRTMNMQVYPVLNTESAAWNFRKRWDKYFAASTKRMNDERARFEKFQADTTNYFAGNARYKKSVANVETVALRTFQVDNFGVWNVDKYFPVVNNTVIAKFIDEKGNPLEVKTGYLVEKTRNSVYPIYNFKQFRFDPNAENLFWAILPGNKLGVIYPKEFARHEKNQKGVCKFVMKVDENALENTSALKAALRFN